MAFVSKYINLCIWPPYSWVTWSYIILSQTGFSGRQWVIRSDPGHPAPLLIPYESPMARAIRFSEFPLAQDKSHWCILLVNTKFHKMSNKFYGLYHTEILHMPWQQCCRGMCKISMWDYHYLKKNYLNIQVRNLYCHGFHIPAWFEDQLGSSGYIQWPWYKGLWGGCQ